MSVELYYNYRNQSVYEGVKNCWRVSYIYLERAVNRGFGKSNKLVTVDCPSWIHSESDMLAYLAVASEEDRLILHPEKASFSAIKDSLEAFFGDEDVENFVNGTFTDKSYLEDPDVSDSTIVIVSYTDPNGNVTVVNEWAEEEPLDESFDAKSMKINSRNLTVGQMAYKFKQLGYKCYGYIKTDHKRYNNFDYVNFGKALPEDIRSMAYKYGKKIGLSYTPSMSDADLNIWGRDEGVKFTDIEAILKQDTKEGVEKATNKDGSDTYYVFFNNAAKYFYFICTYSPERTQMAYIELYVKVKKDGVDVVRKELEEIRDADEADTRKRQEEYEIKRKEEDEHRRLKEAEKEAIRKKTEELENYVEDNEDKFIEVKNTKELPAEFEEYASFDKIIEYGRYDDAKAMRYVCNQDYSMLYKYRVHLSWARPGTYWGD